MDKNWLLDFSGCDGGTIGSPNNRSIWVCGIEWGGGQTAEELKNYINQKWDGSDNFGYDKNGVLDYYPYNMVTYKLLAVMQDYHLNNYKKFVEIEMPFLENGHSSYFKMNLYPIAFKKTNANLWTNEIAEVSGFKTKKDYLQWCKENRFPVIQWWVQKYAPKLIICFGKTYAHEFNLAFADNEDEFNIEEVGNLTLQWKKNNNGTIIAVLPFPNAPNKGLKSHSDIEAMGKKLKQFV
ncbi:hypothetical protein SKB0120_20920 [Moraxella osloensis]